MDEMLYRREPPSRRKHEPLMPDFFDDRPPWLAVPQTDLEKKFAEFHRVNPKVYEAIEKRCLTLFDLGRTRIGVAELVEELRYDPRLVTQGETFKINNSYRSFYARLLIHHHSKLASVIGIREQTSSQPKAGQ